MTRLEANIKILDILQSYLKAYPDMRFGQALYNLGIATYRKEAELTEEGKSKLETDGENVVFQTTDFVITNKDIFFDESEFTLKLITNGK